MLAGLNRDEPTDSLRRLIDSTDVRYNTDFPSSSQLRYAWGVLRAAAGEHEAAVAELRGCALDHPVFGGREPGDAAVALSGVSLTQLGRHGEARSLAADEARRAKSFGAPRAIGIALRAQALVGPREERHSGLEAARDILASSPARLEHARVLLDLGATLRAAGQRTAAREPRARGGRRHQPRDRADAIRHRKDGRNPPGTNVPQARHLLAPQAPSRPNPPADG